MVRGVGDGHPAGRGAGCSLDRRGPRDRDVAGVAVLAASGFPPRVRDNAVWQQAAELPPAIGRAAVHRAREREGQAHDRDPSQRVVALRAHQQAQRKERMAAASLWKDHDLVFTSTTGGKIDPRRDWAEWKAILQAARVHDARLHDARHTAATLLLEQGVDARVIMEILGHSQISLTQNTYQHVMPRIIADATGKVGGVLFPPVATTVAPSGSTGAPGLSVDELGDPANVEAALVVSNHEGHRTHVAGVDRVPTVGAAASGVDGAAEA